MNRKAYLGNRTERDPAEGPPAAEAPVRSCGAGAHSHLPPGLASRPAVAPPEATRDLTGGQHAFGAFGTLSDGRVTVLS